jgi:hypothetical protein
VSKVHIANLQAEINLFKDIEKAAWNLRDNFWDEQFRNALAQYLWNALDELKKYRARR